MVPALGAMVWYRRRLFDQLEIVGRHPPALVLDEVVLDLLALEQCLQPCPPHCGDMDEGILRPVIGLYEAVPPRGNKPFYGSCGHNMLSRKRARHQRQEDRFDLDDLDAALQRL